jgi:hypothetical protein
MDFSIVDMKYSLPRAMREDSQIHHRAATVAG